MTKGNAVRSVALPPTAEADSIAWFLRDYLKLPVTVAVVEDSIEQLPAPDGRRYKLDTAYYGHGDWIEPGSRGGPRDIPVLYYGPNGKLRYAGDYSEPPLIRELIAHDMDDAHLAAISTSSSISPQASLPLPS